MENKRRFEMVEKGWEYKTNGYVIKKGYDRVATTNTGFSVLDRYGWKRKWSVYPDREKRIYSFSTLKEAKDFVIAQDKEEQE